MTSNQHPPFFVMINFEQSVGDYPSIDEARVEGQKMCDSESIPSTWSIVDSDGNEVERIERTDGQSLSDQIASFNRLHGMRSA